MHDDDVWFRPPEPLGLPMAAIGLVCGLFLTDFMFTLRYLAESLCLTSLDWPAPDSAVEWADKAMAAGIYALAYGTTGRWVASRVASGGPPKRSMALGLLAASEVSGCIIGVLTAGELATVAIIGGVVMTAFSLPFALLLCHNVDWAWRSRRGSILNATYRGARWIDVTTSVTVLLALYANPMFGTGHLMTDGRSDVALYLVLVASCGAAAVALHSVVSLWRVSRLRRRFAGAVTPEDRSGEDGALIFDIGIGDQCAHDMARAASAYRHQDRVEAVCVGDIARAWRVIGMSLGRSLSIVVLGAFLALTELQFAPIFYGFCRV